MRCQDLLLGLSFSNDGCQRGGGKGSCNTTSSSTAALLRQLLPGSAVLPQPSAALQRETDGELCRYRLQGKQQSVQTAYSYRMAFCGSASGEGEAHTNLLQHIG